MNVLVMTALQMHSLIEYRRRPVPQLIAQCALASESTVNLLARGMRIGHQNGFD